MALMMSAPCARASYRKPRRCARSNPRRTRHQTFQTNSASLAATEVLPYDRDWPRKAEGVFRSLAIREGIRFHTEPRHFRTGLKGRGMNGIRPDFYLSGLGIYVEVTVGSDAVEKVKRKKIAGAVRYAQSKDRDLVILLFGDDLMRDLRDRELTLRDAIAQELELQTGLKLEDLQELRRLAAA